MTIESAELVIRATGAWILMAAWIYSGWGAFRAATHGSSRSVGLAKRMRAHTLYALSAVPYFAVCFLLWRPLPLTITDGTRVGLLIAGTLVGLTGAGFYLLGRRELGPMYNVSSSLGSELFTDHVLVTSGPYSLCRHPMYFGLFLAAAGGLMVYRTWSMVFVCLSLLGAVVKAGREERLLADEFGLAWSLYEEEVPAWIPRLTRRSKEVSHVSAAARG